MNAHEFEDRSAARVSDKIVDCADAGSNICSASSGQNRDLICRACDRIVVQNLTQGDQTGGGDKSIGRTVISW